MSFEAEIRFLETLCTVLSGTLALAVALALFALIEARRWHAIAAATDPLLAISGESLSPYGARLIGRLRKWGAR